VASFSRLGIARRVLKIVYKRRSVGPAHSVSSSRTSPHSPHDVSIPDMRCMLLLSASSPHPYLYSALYLRGVHEEWRA